jgi:hypothetical protein
VSESFGYIPKSGIAGSNGRSMFRFLRSLQIFFQSGCKLAFPPAMYEGSFFPTSSPTPIVSSVFDDGYSNRGKVES